MMKQFPDLQVAYPVSPDKRNDFIPQPKHSKSVTDPAQLPMALNAKQVAEISAKASEMAHRAEWKNFAPNYFKAFEFAMRKANLIK